MSGLAAMELGEAGSNCCVMMEEQSDFHEAGYTLYNYKWLHYGSSDGVLRVKQFHWSPLDIKISI